MGIYDPKRQTDVAKIATQQLEASDADLSSDAYNFLRDALSHGSDITLSSLSALRQFLPPDLPTESYRLTHALDKLTGAMSLLTNDHVVRLPNEIITETVPPLDTFEECKKLNGLGLWDQRGLWHCLFPKSAIHTDQSNITQRGKMLSREDVENDSSDTHGLWFSSLTDLLNWQVDMKKVIKEQNDKQWKEWKAKETKKWKSIWSTDGLKDSGDSSVVSSQMESSLRTLDSGDYERITIERKKFSDGTKKAFEKTEILSPNGEVKSVTQKDL